MLPVNNTIMESPASVAQSDARPTGDQEVMGSISGRPGNAFVETGH